MSDNKRNQIKSETLLENNIQMSSFTFLVANVFEIVVSIKGSVICFFSKTRAETSEPTKNHNRTMQKAKAIEDGWQKRCDE